MRYLVLAALLILSACAPKADEARRAIVTTASGPVIGVVGKGFFRFDNLPYGRDVKPWATPRDASTVGPDCQPGAAGNDPCLNLTLITPVGKAKAPIDLAFDTAAVQSPGHILVIAHVRPGIPQDKQAVHDWIKANASAFSGDPAHIRAIGPKTPGLTS